MPDVVKRWTREEVLALPDDGNRYELIDGSTALNDRTKKRRRYQKSRVGG